jgi:hypothetical protein
MSEQAIRMVVATADSVFGARCESLFGGDGGIVSVTVHADLIRLARRGEPDVVLFDIDYCDPADVSRLTAKLSLVSSAVVVLATAYHAPGSAALGALLQTVSATAVLKPDGASSLSLSGAGAEAFRQALTVAINAQARADEHA